MPMQAQHAVSIVPGSLQAVPDLHPGPGGPHGFHVTVDVEVDTGWTAALVAATPQGINPLIKLLRFAVLPSGDAGAAGALATARRTLRYAETPPGAHYAEVWLGDGDRAVSAPVVVVG